MEDNARRLEQDAEPDVAEEMSSLAYGLSRESGGVGQKLLTPFLEDNPGSRPVGSFTASRLVIELAEVQSGKVACCSCRPLWDQGSNSRDCSGDTRVRASKSRS